MPYAASMNRLSMLAWLPIACGCAAAPAPSPASPGPDSAAKLAIAQVLDDLNDAAAKADEPRYFSHFAPDGVFLGTDATERWDLPAFRAFAHPHFAKGRAWAFRATRRAITVSPDGRLAWFDEDLDTEKLGPARGSGVLALQAGGWVIEQYNLATVVPNDRFAEVRALLDHTADTSAASATLVQRGHDLLAAMDRGDVAAVEPALAPDYFHFDGDYVDREHELTGLRARKPDAPHIGARTWSHERASVHANDAIVVGEAHEHATGNDSHGGYDYDGWYTLAWTREGDAWRLAFLGWKQGAGRPPCHVERDLPQLDRLQARAEPPARRHRGAPAAGRRARHREGAGPQRAVPRAGRGWRVTGVDISDEGITQARTAAAQRKLTLDAVETDIDRYDFGKNRWDLVTMIYATDNAAWMEKIKASLHRGGLFVLEYFALDPSMGQDDGIPPGKLAKIFGDGFEILRDEVVDDVADWAVDRAKLVRFVARKK